MVIVGVVLIVAVLVDAWRRLRRDKTAMVRVKLINPDDLPAPVNDLAQFRELPNGGARVVDRGDLLRAKGYGRGGAKENTSRTTAKNVPGKRPTRDADDLVTGITSAGSADEPENLDWLDGLVSKDSQAIPDPMPAPGKLPRYEAPEVFMLNVLARSDQGFRGDDILHILLACDLRFGDMNFFHRHEFEAGRGAIQFSVANMMQPGVFDIDNMADMSTPGLVFFLTLPGPEDMMKAFDYMLETAQTVARNLGADVLDESRSVLTRQATEHSRQQIRELERRLLAKAR